MSTDQEKFESAVLQGIKSALETESKNRKLEVKNITVPKRVDPNDLTRIKAARLSGKSFADKVYADINILDKSTGKTINSGRVHVADIPVKTPINTYLVDGVHYQNTNQAQLKGTGFTQIKDNGEVETDFRLEKGWNFKLGLDPESERFEVKYKSSRFPLMAIMDVMGVSKSQLESAWGKGILKQNLISEKKSEAEIRKLARKILGERVRGKSITEIRAALKDYFEKESKLNPDASRITLGQPYETVVPGALLAATQKILKIHANEAEPDNKDEIYFKRFRDLPETGKEWIDESARSIQTKVRRRIEKEDIDLSDIRSVIGMDVVNPVVKSMFTKAKLRGAGESTNLLDILANDSRVTVMGEHGISDRHRVSNSARDVRPGAAGFIDPVMTPQGSAGETQHLSIGSKIENGKLKSFMRDIRTGRLVSVSPEDLFGKTVAFPEEGDIVDGKFKPKHWSGRVKAVKNGEIITVKPNEVDYIIPSAEMMYSEVTNMVPFLNSDSGGRAILATGQMTQAVPLEEPDAPLVRANNVEAADVFSMGAKSPVDGVVKSIKPGLIKIEDGSRRIHNVRLYDNLPLNRESFLDSKPLVRKGDQVKKGQILADNNFTKDGVLAIGKNLNVAMMPWKGYNYEDGQVISESAAKKLSSVHLYDLSEELGDKSKLDPGRWQSYGGFKYKLSPENHASLDPKTGLIKPGSIVRKGDILAKVVTKSEDDPENHILRIFRKSLAKPFQVNPIVWDRADPGIVVDAKASGRKVNLFVKAVEKAQVGDKIADRHGHKGVITKILSDTEMPRLADTDEPIDVMIDPASVPSRVNIGQILEMGASKISKKTGKPYIAPIHSDENSAMKIKKELEALGIKDKAAVIDPVSGKKIDGVNVAPKYLMKLRHQVESKLTARNASGSYDIDEQPIKGRSIDGLTFYSLVAHGAKKNLGEMANLKSQRNPEFWADYEAGAPIALPDKPTYAWDKFDASLKAMGINPRRSGDKIMIGPLTDKDTLDLSGGNAITTPDVVRKKNFKPVKGGIFDEYIHGGRGKDAKQWSHIPLPEPVLSPIYTRAASAITGMSQSELKRIARGEKDIEGVRGGPAIKNILDKIDVKSELEKAIEESKALSRGAGQNNYTKMDKINRRIRYLQGLAKYSLTPSEAYLMNYVPVMPPVFRTPITLPDGNVSVPAVNYLYKDVALESLKSWKDAVTDNTKNEIRKDLYDTISALVGTGEPVGMDDMPGILKQITGKSTETQKKKGINKQSKHGYFKNKVMRKRQDLSAGAVISVEPKLGVDEVEVPEDAAWKIFEPMIKRRLVRMYAYSPSVAKEKIDNRTSQARAALQEEMSNRPVLINRAPSWHKFNIMGAWPKLHPGNDLKVPNLPINAYFGGDFDGDTMSIHVPVTEDAVNEAKEMMPSKLFLKSGSGTVMLQPQGSSLAGLYDMTADKPISKQWDLINSADGVKEEDLDKFYTKTAQEGGPYKIGDKELKDPQELKKAYEAGLIYPHEKLKRGDGATTTVGRQLINDILPEGWNIGNKQIDRSAINTILAEIARDKPAALAQTANELNRLGDHQATYMGLSLGIDDIAMDKSPGEDIVKNLVRDINYVDTKWKFKQGREAAVSKTEKKAKLFSDAINKMDKEIVDSLPDDNGFKILWKSGAKGKETQLRQILGPPALFRSSSKDIYHPVERSFSAGLDPASYYIQQTGGRFGLVQRGVETAVPGDIGKDLLGVNSSNSITEEDCGTTDGIVRDINSRDIIGRYAAEGNSIVKRNDPIHELTVVAMKRAKVKKVKVRSPLTCKAKNGVCAMCYGETVYGKKPSLGEAVGIEDAQGMVDVIANLALKSWHLSGGKETNELPFDRFRRIIDMPKTIPDKAVLARENGYIDNIEKNDLGGIDVYIRGERHRLPANLGVSHKVKKGARIKKGDQLTLYGNKRPQDVLELRNIRDAQEYIVDEIADIFESEKPGKIGRRSIENVTASITGLARVADPGDSDYVPYDIGRANDMDFFNRNRIEEVPIKEAVGYRLHENKASHLPAGTEVSSDVVKELRKLGVKRVKIEKRPIVFEPILKNVRSIPRYKNDWLSRLNQKYLSETLIDEAAAGGESDIHGFDPVPAYAYGAEFGRPSKSGTPPHPARY